MTPDGPDVGRLADSLDEIRAQLNQLGQRITALEQAAALQDSVAAARTERVDKETLITISAAIAAYLGKKPRIRQLRLIGTSRWAQQGRATIQASHTLNVRHS